MRRLATLGAIVVLASPAFSRNQKISPPLPNEFKIGRHTFFDFGPPFDFYELFIVLPSGNGTSVKRITLTPAADKCYAPAKIEVALASLNEPIGALFGTKNPCAIPEKALRHELKRCRKCLVFSGAVVEMQFQCGGQMRLARSDILDKDMFDPAAKTPEYTSWTMRLLSQLDQAVGPGAMDKPMFPLPATETPHAIDSDSKEIRDLSTGKYDGLFPGAPDKPSDLYRAAQIRPPDPTVHLDVSTPLEPEKFVAPNYPPIARVAHVEGNVAFHVSVAPDGTPLILTLVFDRGPALFQGAIKNAVANWKFPQTPSGSVVEATIEFKLNCSSQSH